MEDEDDFLPTKRVRARYGGKSEKTIERWIELGVLPPPTWINGRRYWRRSVLEQHERDRLSAHKRKPTAA
jgi:hypothetical protein